MAKRILIIEDDKLMRSLLTDALNGAGFETVSAVDGDKGLALYNEAPTDLVVTDLLMPQKSGTELIKQLKAEYPDVKIIAISGGGMVSPEEYLVLAEVYGADQVFQKPLDIKLFVKSVEQLIAT